MNYGRLKIYSDAKEITAANVAEEVSKAFAVHIRNQADIMMLWDYYRGKTRILFKEKEIREKINHKINENRAYEVVKFHKGYVFGEPIQYVRRENTYAAAEDDVIAADINALNGYMDDASKAACDNAIAEWMYVTGKGYRLTLPNVRWTADGDEPPFVVYALEPLNTFVVYSSDVDKHPLMGVCCVVKETGEKVFSVYTDNAFYEFEEHGAVTTKPNPLGMIPIIEYPLENSGLGVFEPVLTQLDAIDELQSNRMDDIVQFVNSFLAVLGGEVSKETYEQLEEWKMLCLPEGTDAKYLSATLSQADVQTLKDDFTQAIFEICAVPNRTGGESASDNGVAVLLRNGYTASEARAKDTEETWKKSEKLFLRLILRILRDTVGTNLKLTDIKPHFTRRNYENIATKSQVLISMLNNPKIHPEVAYSSCGMFPDPESAYLQGKAYYEEQMEKWEAVEVDETEDEGDDVQAS